MKTFWNAFALRTVWDSFFMNDAHFIVSRHGREILAKMQQKEALIELMNIDLVKGKETLEEAVNNFKKTDVYINEIKQAQKRMYSEEEVIRILDKREDYLGTEPSIFDYLTNKEWFEQFKNK